MTEQPAESVPDHPVLAALDSVISRARAFQTVIVPNSAPVDEQVWLGNALPDIQAPPHGRDEATAAAFDVASDAYDAAGSAFEDGRLNDAKNHVYVFLSAIVRLQIAEAAAAARS